MNHERIGRYLVKRALSEGDASPIWLAYDPLLDRPVELRRVADAKRLSTLRTQTALDHPAVVPVFAAEQGPDGVYAATAHIEGRPLPEWLRERSRSVPEILDVLLQCGGALAAAHAQGLGHGAFDSSSVILGWDGRVYVRGLGDAPAWTTQDDTRAFVTTLAAAFADTPPADIPDRVRRATATGAEPAPLKTLLRRLARDPRVTLRRRLVIASATVAVAALGALWVFAPWRAPLCPEAVERLAGVWDEPVRARAKAAFLGSGLTEASYAWTATANALDAFAASWLAAHRDACTATHVRRVQTTEQLDLRMACLDGRRRELAGLSSVFAEADTETVRRAPQAIAALSPIGRCANLEMLARGLRGPTDAAAKDRAARLARARALRLAGRYDDALALATSVAIDARAGGDHAIEAEADTVVGQLETRARRGDRAEEALLRAAFRSLETSHDLAFAEATSALVNLGYEDRSRRARAKWWATHARTALDRAGNPTEFEQMLALRLGDMEVQQGHLREAQRHFERALELTPADNSALRGTAEDRLGRVHRLLDEPELAVEHQQRSLAAFIEAHGPVHPNVAVSMQSLALALRNADRLREAMVYHRRALEMQERTVGKDHPDRAGIENGLAITLWILGDVVGAHERFTSALAAYTARYGEKHVTVASVKLNLVPVLLRLGRAREAEAMAEDALRLATDLRGPQHLDTADGLVALARCLLPASPRPAMEHIERALAIKRAAAAPDAPALGGAGLVAAQIQLLLRRPEKARALLEEVLRKAGPKDPVALEANTELGRALVLLRDDAAALAAFERAVALTTTMEGNPLERGQALVELARHLTRKMPRGSGAGAGRTRAAALLEAAHAAFSSTNPVDAEGLVEVKRVRAAW